MSDRRTFLQTAAATGLGSFLAQPASAAEGQSHRATDLTITEVRITPIALPDPPILAASGCHGPYFLRNIIEITTEDGVVGIGETRGGLKRTEGLLAAAKYVVGQSAFAYRAFPALLTEETAKINDPAAADPAVYAGLELACLDAVGKATGQSLSRLLGGPVRDEVEFAAYLFFRYAADHPRVFDDEHLADNRGHGDKALDDWGEVRTPEAMANMAKRWRERFGFNAMKLKAGVLPPDVELDALKAINEAFAGKTPLRIDPNGRWTIETALRIARELQSMPLEYYEDPVAGQEAMATVRRETGLPMSTNMCVTRFDHIADAVKNEPVDIVLCDHHGWGGIPVCQALGTLADSLGWRLSQHSNNHAGLTMAAMTHVGAVTPQIVHPSDTHYPWLVEGADIIEGPNLKFEGGKMKVPNGPGLGVALDHDKLARAHEVYQKSGMRERNDAVTMERFEPGWKRDLF
ncbi:MAG: enolase C-terminal domain-like protein [Planctomycetaceae bacterium]